MRFVLVFFFKQQNALQTYEFGSNCNLLIITVPVQEEERNKKLKNIIKHLLINRFVSLSSIYDCH